MAEYKDADFNPGTGSSSITTGTTPSSETPATSDSNVNTGTSGSSVTPTTSDSNLVPSRGAYHAQGQFRFWCQKVLPLVYDDSLSYYELLCKVVDYLNKTMQNVAVLESDVTETNNQFANLQTFVNETVDKQAESFNQLQENLNADIEKQNTAFNQLQENLNNNIKAQNDAFEQFQTNINGNIEKQDKAFEDLQTYTNDQIATIRQTYLELQQYVNDYFNNLDVQEEINNKLDNMASDGTLDTIISPHLPSVVGDWLKNNLTPTTPPVDSTLSISGAAADAKVTGDNFKKSLMSVVNTVSSSSEVTDLNNLEDQKIYAILGTGLTNVPDSCSYKNGLLVQMANAENTGTQLFFSQGGELAFRNRWGGNWGDWTYVNKPISAYPTSLSESNAPDLDNINDQGVYALLSDADIAHRPTNVSSSNGLLFYTGNTERTATQFFLSREGDFAYRSKWGGTWGNWTNLRNSLSPILNTISTANGYTSMDTLTDQKVYAILGSGMTNYPSGISASGLLIQFANAANTGMQLLITNKGELAYRNRWGGNWGSWEIIHDNIVSALISQSITVSTENDYTDLNNLTDQRVYAIIGTGMTNYPSGINTNGLLIQFANAANTGMQLLITQLGELAYRSRWGGNWGSWVTIPTNIKTALTTVAQTVSTANGYTDLNNLTDQRVYAMTNIGDASNIPEECNSLSGLLVQLANGTNTGAQLFFSNSGDFAYRVRWAGTWGTWQYPINRITALETELEKNINEGFASNDIFTNRYNGGSTSGITISKDGNNYKLEGTATADAVFWLSGSHTTFPDFLPAGSTRTITHEYVGTGSVQLRVAYNVGDDMSWALQTYVNGSDEVTIPDTATGAIVLVLIPNGSTVNGTFSIRVSTGELTPSNLELSAKIDNYFDSKEFLYAGFYKVGVIGDSYSSTLLYSSGTSTNVPYYSWGKYMERMSGMNYQIFAKGGLEVSQWLTDVDNGLPVAELEDNLCQAYIIALGINDSARHPIDYIGTVADINDTTPDENGNTFIGNYAKIIQSLKAKIANAKFFLVTMPVATSSGSNMESRFQDYNTAIRTIADHFENCYVLDLAADYADYYTSDFWQNQLQGSHPTPVGNAYSAKIIANAINNVMYKNISEFRSIDWMNDKRWMP